MFIGGIRKNEGNFSKDRKKMFINRYGHGLEFERGWEGLIFQQREKNCL